MDELLQLGFSEHHPGCWQRWWHLSRRDIAVVTVRLDPFCITCNGSDGVGYAAANLIRAYLLACARRELIPRDVTRLDLTGPDATRSNPMGLDTTRLDLTGPGMIGRD